MEMRQEAVINAIILTKKAHSACGFYLPAFVLRLHIRRLKRLEKAIKKHCNDEDSREKIGATDAKAVTTTITAIDTPTEVVKATNTTDTAEAEPHTAI